MASRLAIFLCLLLPLLKFSINNGLVIKMTNIVCESRNKSWVTFETCRLRAIQRNKTIANIFATFLHSTNSVSLRIQVQKKFNGYKPWLIDVTIDACKFMKSPKSNKVAKVVWDLFKNFSTVNHPCPYVGKQYVNGFYPDTGNFPLILPTGDYVLLLTWSFYERIQFVTNVYFTFVEDILKM